MRFTQQEKMEIIKIVQESEIGVYWFEGVGLFCEFHACLQ